MKEKTVLVSAQIQTEIKKSSHCIKVSLLSSFRHFFTVFGTYKKIEYNNEVVATPSDCYLLLYYFIKCFFHISDLQVLIC